MKKDKLCISRVKYNAIKLLDEIKANNPNIENKIKTLYSKKLILTLSV